MYISPVNFSFSNRYVYLKQQSREWTIANGEEKEGMSQID